MRERHAIAPSAEDAKVRERPQYLRVKRALIGSQRVRYDSIALDSVVRDSVQEYLGRAPKANRSKANLAIDLRERIEEGIVWRAHH